MIDKFLEENSSTIEELLKLIYNSEYTNFSFNVKDEENRKMVVMFVTNKNDEEFEMASLFASQVLMKNPVFEQVKNDVIETFSEAVEEKENG